MSMRSLICMSMFQSKVLLFSYITLVSHLFCLFMKKIETTNCQNFTFLIHFLSFKMTLQSKSKIFSYSSEIGDLILNSSPNLVDIYINSGLDGRCFRAHRVVLAAASEILANILDTSCQFCGGEPDENTALTFAGVSGTTLENFLALCYTGVSLNIKDYRDESELKSFCSEFKLYSPESLVRISNPSTDFILGSVLSQDETPVGYNECDNLKTLLSGEVLKLAAVCPEIVEQHFDDLINAGTK